MNLDPLAIVHRRLHDQRLTGERLGSAGAVVASLLAVQAQEYAEAKWSIAERSAGLHDADLDAALAAGEIIRTHVLRPTWHFVTPQDIGWLLELTEARVRRTIRSYDKQFGVTDELRERCSEVLEHELSGGEASTRKELRAALAEEGIEIEGPTLGHVMMHAELDGLICSGPLKGKQQTYVLLASRVPKPRSLEREEALGELCLRYFTGHGPATVRDCSWWSGLTMTDIRIGLEIAGDRLESVEDADGTRWYAAPAPSRVPRRKTAFLIPMYDELGVAFKDLRMVYAGGPPPDGVMARPIVIAGETVGSWKRVLSSNAATLEATLLVDLDQGRRRALDAAVTRFSAFLGLPVELEASRV